MLWITGGKGLLGSALSERCLASSFPAIITGKEVDITDLRALHSFLKENSGITHIVNCAAFSQVDAAETFREDAYRVNVIGAENLAFVAGEMGIKLIHISTDYVFSGKEKRLYRETDPTDPCGYYGVTKLEGERRVLLHSFCVIRTSWIFGKVGLGKNFVSKLLGMLQSEKKIHLTDDQWGRFTYAPDLAEVIFQMLDQQGLFQFANAGVASRYEFGLAMREEALSLGFPLVTEEIIGVPGASFPTACIRPSYSALDTTKIEQFVALRPWQAALRDFLCAQRPVYL